MLKEVNIVLFVAAMLLGISAGNLAAVELSVVDFDDLDYDWTLSGTSYAGLTWEWGNEIDGHLGEWWIPLEGYDSHPYSQPHYVINGWGATLMGISFPEPIDVLGGYFAEAGNPTPGVRVHGYLGETEVATTGWFNDIDTIPSWFAMNLNNVDRIVIESLAHHGTDPSGYGMDKHTYTPQPATN